MIVKISDNIISPLGRSTQENFQAVKEGRTGLRWYNSKWNLREPFTASLFDDGAIDLIFRETTGCQHTTAYSDFEKLAISSIHSALVGTAIDPSSQKVIFIISTTKGNVSCLSGRTEAIPQEAYIGQSGFRVSQFFNNGNTPIIVSNACTSGVCAQIIAMRYLVSGKYDTAIVCGCDIQSEFIISGFQSFKALSLNDCKPFDKNRSGVNLGEAAATIILSYTEEQSQIYNWRLINGVIRNDANHISGPSRTGEGCFRALTSVTHHFGKENVSIINAHGTGTAYNDEMESIALNRAGLADTPINGLKGYFGHTMGAAGILESVINMYSLDMNIAIGTRGFETQGTSTRLNIDNKHRAFHGSGLIKTLSGFGGCNAAISFTKDPNCLVNYPERIISGQQLEIAHSVTITPSKVVVDGNTVDEQDGGGENMLLHLYKKNCDSYPKFYKMDTLCKLGLIAAELLLLAEGKERFVVCDDTAVVLFNKSGSLANDFKYQQTINDSDNYYPSPSVFVYTLANIVTGEISIRNKYHGESSFYILPYKNTAVMDDIISVSFQDTATSRMITGWIDCTDEYHYEVEMKLIYRK